MPRSLNCKNNCPLFHLAVIGQGPLNCHHHYCHHYCYPAFFESLPLLLLPLSIAPLILTPVLTPLPPFSLPRSQISLPGTIFCWKAFFEAFHFCWGLGREKIFHRIFFPLWTFFRFFIEAEFFSSSSSSDHFIAFWRQDFLLTVIDRKAAQRVCPVQQWENGISNFR